MGVNGKPPLGARLDFGDSISNGLVACYLVNEGGGFSVYDLSQYRHTLTRNGATNVTGPSGVALHFNGTPGTDFLYLSALKYNFNGKTAASLSCWVLADSGISNGAPVYYPNTTGTQALGMLVVNSTTVRFDVTGSGTNRTTPNLTTGGMHHLLTTWDGTTKTSYCDGVQLESVAIGGSLTTSVNEFNVGRFSSGNFNGFPGIVDNVRLWNRVLTQNEVTRLFVQPYAGIARYRKRGARVLGAVATGWGPLIGQQRNRIIQGAY